MTTLCTCGHAGSQHHVREKGGRRICDYSGTAEEIERVTSALRRKTAEADELRESTADLMRQRDEATSRGLSRGLELAIELIHEFNDQVVPGINMSQQREIQLHLAASIRRKAG